MTVRTREGRQLDLPFGKLAEVDIDAAKATGVMLVTEAERA